MFCIFIQSIEKKKQKQTFFPIPHHTRVMRLYSLKYIASMYKTNTMTHWILRINLILLNSDIPMEFKIKPSTN